ncbi:O-antigen ligase family protein [Collinsella ihumii]|uniref:O-antigen ligase family protein n=1 Tax=Collinsella ihumii TaxID=1720204 RepID=UPI000A818FDC|nr:O-antigen ligase family protein [Collinsella ihumii]
MDKILNHLTSRSVSQDDFRLISNRRATHTTKISQVTVFHISIYLILIPFLYPKGLDQLVPLSKQFFTAWLYLAMLIMLCFLAKHLMNITIQITVRSIFVVLFFMSSILITLYDQQGFAEGLQALFAWPLLCLWLTFAFAKDHKSILNAIINIMIILFLFQNIFTYLDVYRGQQTACFFGHIQVVAQEAIIAFLAVSLYSSHLPKKSCKRIILLVALVVLALWSVDTDSSKVVLILFFIALILNKNKKVKLMIGNSAPMLAAVLIIASLLVVDLSVRNSTLFGFDWGFNGRDYVWREAIGLIQEEPVLGYGVQGVQMTLFWGGIMNYAHNQLMQTLLDGGIVLLILFITMIITYAVQIRIITDLHARYWITCALTVYLILMIFDSATYYCYLYLLLPLSDYYAINQQKTTAG